MTTASILVGSGRYQDRWHDFSATGQAIAGILAWLGLDVRLRSTKPASILDAAEADLLVVNAGRGEYSAVADGPPEDWCEAFNALRRFRDRRGPILAVHASANSFQGLYEWANWIGGQWVPGRSMHPPISQATVSLIDPEHPITREVSSMSLYDELYSYLEVSPEMKVLISHEYEGRKHPLVWACEQDGARCVYDAFGHDVQSYASADRCMLIRREVKWLLGPELPDSELLQPTNGW